MSARFEKQFYADVGARLRLARDNADLSQQKAGEAVGVTFQMIQKYESGRARIPLDKVCSLAELYNVSAYDLMGVPQGRSMREAQLEKMLQQVGKSIEHVIEVLQR